MIIQIPAAQAVTEMDKLLGEVAQGREVVIIGADGSAFKLVALPRTPKPVFGSAWGLVHIGPDFDEPIEGFEDYMP
jgi:antitoxin (DNA-binding transcriptional repressor) of toxin-antitoxin stability system